MSSLRRDLVERKLWMVVALLVVAVVAVPVFLLKSASANTAPTVPAPPSAAPAGAQTSTTENVDTKKESPKVVLARIARNPFASAVPVVLTRDEVRAVLQRLDVLKWVDVLEWVDVYESLDRVELVRDRQDAHRRQHADLDDRLDPARHSVRPAGQGADVDDVLGGRAFWQRPPRASARRHRASDRAPVRQAA